MKPQHTQEDIEASKDYFKQVLEQKLLDVFGDLPANATVGQVMPHLSTLTNKTIKEVISDFLPDSNPNVSIDDNGVLWYSRPNIEELE